MKIALIAMSGIRAENPQPTERGVKLPGFLERAQTLFAMPSLSLLTLAGMVPAGVEIEHREYREFPAEQPPECDLVAITSFTAQIEDAYRIADIYSSRGTTIIMGGLHVSKMPKRQLVTATRFASVRANCSGRRFSLTFARAGSSLVRSNRQVTASTYLARLCRVTTCLTTLVITASQCRRAAGVHSSVSFAPVRFC